MCIGSMSGILANRTATPNSSSSSIALIASVSLRPNRSALLAWVPGDVQPGNATKLLDDFLGGQDTWDAMAHVHQSETIVINRAWIPGLMKKAQAEYADDMKAQGYPVVVTLNVTRQLRGDPGANSDLGYSLTVMMLCPPHQACRGVAPARSVIEK